MYFFFRNLSFLEICFTLTVVPKLLVIFLSENKSISFSGCTAQMFFFFIFGTVECFLPVAVAYDHYVDICHPLHYTSIMNRRMCFQIMLALWISGILKGMVQVKWLFSFPFCWLNEVDHFCDGPLLIQLVCADTYKFEINSFMATVIIIMVPFVLIMVSYICIIYTMQRMTSPEGERKAFNTCSSLLTVVILFYGTSSLTYIWPKSSYSPDTKKLSSLSYTVITPMLDPIIYSLRNNEVKGAWWRTLNRKRSSW